MDRALECYNDGKAWDGKEARDLILANLKNGKKPLDRLVRLKRNSLKQQILLNERNKHYYSVGSIRAQLANLGKK